MVQKSFDKKSAGRGIKNEIKQNKQLENELHKPIIGKFKRRIEFKDNIWGGYLADMQLISKCNKYLKTIAWVQIQLICN